MSLTVIWKETTLQILELDMKSAFPSVKLCTPISAPLFRGNTYFILLF